MDGIKVALFNKRRRTLRGKGEEKAFFAEPDFEWD
jgi:hypothetical protein